MAMIPPPIPIMTIPMPPAGVVEIHGVCVVEIENRFCRRELVSSSLRSRRYVSRYAEPVAGVPLSYFGNGNYFPHRDDAVAE